MILKLDSVQRGEWILSIKDKFAFVGVGLTEQGMVPEYDFNDDLLPIGAGFWTYLTEAFLAPDSV